MHWPAYPSLSLISFVIQLDNHTFAHAVYMFDSFMSRLKNLSALQALQLQIRVDLSLSFFLLCMNITAQLNVQPEHKMWIL